MLAKYWKKPMVARELSRLFGGTAIRDDKLKRIKPIFERLRSSSDETTEASSSTAPLPLDATEPRGCLEIDEFDNLAAVAHANCLA